MRVIREFYQGSHKKDERIKSALKNVPEFTEGFIPMHGKIIEIKKTKQSK